MPELGMTEYWYPAIADRKVPRRKGVRRTLLGQEVVFFRGKEGQVVALSNWCPHRNASLAQGKCHFAGTITCPYHGLTFDETGEAKAFLGEGARSRYIGRRGADARSFPTQTHKGLVFIWMGEGKPSPIAEDVPPEFFDPKSLVLFSQQRWKANWRPALENLQDSHAFYVHRNSLEVLSQDEHGLNLLLHMGPERPPTKIVNGRALVFENTRFFDFQDSQQKRKTNIERAEFQETYPGLGGAKFPRTKVRLHLSHVMGFLRRHLRQERDWMVKDEEWSLGVHLPTTFRFDYQTHVYSRAVTPKNADESWIFYYNTSYPATPLRRLRHRLNYVLYYDWKQHRNFSGQDKRIVEEISYKEPQEKFSSSDAFPLAYRLLVTEHSRKPDAD
ncbi:MULTISPECIES: aromatic ring-hydroxylating oxygenase subunit alpha [unclassified Nocardioides]|uniref:aromatic ring-hydroxylating oxygenase subunit alpha n=1 Tax=unclassified Nocardioides TaxID=2615069 RepID=UPI00138F8824|nr:MULTISPECIES: Rieske 2Fe-2S domain-containing protein [unclassified Nocardioides]